MKLLFLCLTIALLIGSVSAWTIVSPEYSGTVDFYDTGVGVASVNGYPPIHFSWEHVEGKEYVARYLWYSVPFSFNDGVITSTSFPSARLVR
jgi:hypothetical protein